MHYSLSRRTLLRSTLALSLLNLLPTGLFAAGKPIPHPVKGGIPGVKQGQCPNCGMAIQMWGRTRHQFKLGDSGLTTCSIRCLADMSRKKGENAREIQVASYLKPEMTIPADKAIYVIGSDARGTMTMHSKLAFGGQEAANDFIAEYGGKKTDFAGALASATKELDATYAKIEQKRKKKGKIKEPDTETRCVVCGMYPARYPDHNSQVRTGDDSTLHFCSTQCLVNFKTEPVKFLKKPTKIKATWVKVYPEGGWEYADGLNYLVGSSVMGPMGLEALPFRRRKDAEKMAREKGGKVHSFSELTPELVFKRQ